MVRIKVFKIFDGGSNPPSPAVDLQFNLVLPSFLGEQQIMNQEKFSLINEGVCPSERRNSGK